MIDWLRKEQQDPVIDIDGHTLPIAIRRHARARRLTMRLAHDGSEVRITLPRWGRTLDAITFARARSEWLADQLAKVPRQRAIGDGTSVPFRGGELSVRWREDGSRKVVREGGELHLGGPPDRISARIRRWLETEALGLLEGDLAFYCDRATLVPPALRLSRAQKRWGSCSGENGRGRCIRINWRLVMAPDHVRRSVVAHEVAHLVHFDHSPGFYRLLNELYEGELAAADAWLKREGRSLYASFG